MNRRHDDLYAETANVIGGIAVVILGLIICYMVTS